MLKAFFKKLKLQLILGLIASLTLPIISVVACGTKKPIQQDNSIGYYVKNVEPLDFKNIFENNEVRKNEPIYYLGINQTAYTQGASFILNIIRGLGWHWEDKNKVDLLYDSNFSFDTIKPGLAKHSLIDTNHLASNFEKKLSSIFRNSYRNGIYSFLKKNATNKKQIHQIYNQIKSFVYVDKNSSNLEKVDCSTEVKIELASNFESLNDKQKFKFIADKLNETNTLNKIFKEKKYAYDWSGNFLTKLGFQIKENNLLIWHMSDNLPKIQKNIQQIRAQDKKLNNLFKNNSLAVKDRKILSQISIDPFGVSGTMNFSFLVSSTNLKHLSSFFDFYKNKDNLSPWYSSQKYNQLIQTELNGQSLIKNLRTNWYAWNYYHYLGDGIFNWAENEDFVDNEKSWKIRVESPNKSKNAAKNKKGPTQTISTFNSFLDATTPGTTILKMYEGKVVNSLDGNLVVDHPLKTIITKNRIQTFYQLTNDKKIKQMIDLIMRFLNFIQGEIQSKTKEMTELEAILPPSIKSAFEFLRNNKISKTKVDQLFRQYNNGSHYMLAVEIFLRGMKNIPTKLLTDFDVPGGIKLYMNLKGKKFRRKANEIVGMVNVNNIFPFLFLCFTSKKPPGYFFNFYPQTADYLDREVNKMGYFLFDLKTHRKFNKGKETKVYEF